jgi:hypothetical protein
LIDQFQLVVNLKTGKSLPATNSSVALLHFKRQKFPFPFSETSVFCKSRRGGWGKGKVERSRRSDRTEGQKAEGRERGSYRKMKHGYLDDISQAVFP